MDQPLVASEFRVFRRVSILGDCIGIRGFVGRLHVKVAGLLALAAIGLSAYHEESTTTVANKLDE